MHSFNRPAFYLIILLLAITNLKSIKQNSCTTIHHRSGLFEYNSIIQSQDTNMKVIVSVDASSLHISDSTGM